MFDNFGSSAMPLELVVVGYPVNEQPDWVTLSHRENARASFADRVADLANHNFDVANVMIAPFQGRQEFLTLCSAYKMVGGGSLSVAVLPSGDYRLCSEAFRAGANDVLAQPLDPGEFEIVISHLKSRTSRMIHPDAILPLDMVEKTTIKNALAACNGQVSKTARKLGIGRSTLYRKLDLYDLNAR